MKICSRQESHLLPPPSHGGALDLLSYASMLGKWLPDVVPPHEDLVNSQA